MSKNGTDRDIALAILTQLTALDTALSQYNRNLYAAIIFTQPTDQTAAIGTDAVFTISAGNVASYQWQYKSTPEDPYWSDSGLSGATTDTFTVSVTDYRYDYIYRCKITGKDGSVIYSNEVHILEPEANG